jgi:hypothetical protein
MLNHSALLGSCNLQVQNQLTSNETIGDGDARNKRARTVLMPLRSLKPVIYRDTESVDAVSRR